MQENGPGTGAHIMSWGGIVFGSPLCPNLAFSTSPFILKLSPGAENKHVNIFNLIWFLKSEVLLLKGCAKASGILFFFFSLGWCPSQVPDS